MSKQVTVVGSGASGVHFARTALALGHRVTMVDVGHERPAAVLPDADFTSLRERLENPAGYFLGAGFQGVVTPSHDREYYGFPPGKDYVFRTPPGFGFSASGFAPLFSFARGGLAEAWTGGCYPFSDDDLRDFPFDHAALAPSYGEVARRIGVTGVTDDLSRFMPVHDGLLPPLALDDHSAELLEGYQRQRHYFQKGLGCYIGRTRVATLSIPFGDRQECTYLGRCLWGCPREALYTPSITLRECLGDPGFTYLPGLEVRHFRVDPERRITAVVAISLEDGSWREIPVERLVLAAGTLQSAGIVLRSVHAATGEVARLPGLMDNRQVLVPFVNLRRVGRRYRADRYQYHLLGLGLASEDPRAHVHGQLTTLKTALMHPIIQQLPFDLRTSLGIARAAHGALGVVNLNFHDTRREQNAVTLAEEGGALRVAIEYAPPADEPARLGDAVRRLRAALWRLGCLVPPGMAHMRPMGASVHYAGTFPMTRDPRPWTTDDGGRSRDFSNLWFADGSTFPSLPAKNLTFTLMANATRIAHGALAEG
jgi:choline dehydrogenase-like flavoprotein